MTKKSLITLFTAIGILLSAMQGYAGTFTAFGPKAFTRGSGKPVAETISFNIKNPDTTYTLHIYIGGINSEYTKVSSAIIIINGSTVFDESDFNQQVSQLQKQVAVESSNTLSVELRSAPGSGFTVLLEGEDDTPPEVNISAPANNTYTNTPSMAVSGNASDATSLVNAITVNEATATLTGEAYTSNIQLAEGQNTITATATDAAGNTSSSSITVTLDTTPPAITITSPTNGSTVNTSSVTVSGTIDDNAATVTVNDVNAIISTNTFTASNITLAEGTNSITVTAKDRAGNQTSRAITITRSTGPVITVQYPAEGAIFSIPNLDVYGIISEDTTAVTINGIVAYLNGNFFTSSPGGVPDGFGPIAPPSIFLPNIGENKITITAKNAVGQTSSKTVTVYYYDTKAPQISSIYLTKRGIDYWGRYYSYLIQKGGFTWYDSIDVDFSVYDRSSPITVTLNGQRVNNEYNSYHGTSLSLSEGLNNIIVTATDAVGNKATETTSVTLDTKDPVITITSPANYAYLNTSSITVTGSIEEDNIDTVSLNINNAGFNTSATVENNIFTASGIPLNEGSNAVTVKAKDKMGRTGYAHITVYKDTLAPRISISSPTNGSTVSAGIITVSGTVSENTATVTVNGINAIVANNKFTANNISLTEGANTITAIATDKAGNSATNSVTITYVRDTIPPLAVISSPANGIKVNTENITITGIIDDNTATVTVNGINAAVSNNAFTAPNVPLTEGQNTITVTATDPAGNTSSAAIIIYCDTTGPTVLSTSPAAEETVAIDTVITVTFSETIDPAKITTGIFTLYSPLGNISGTITVTGNTATFTPLYTLDSDTAYTATIKGGSGGVKDIMGWPMSSDNIWNFKTGIGPLGLTIMEPRNGAIINKGQTIVRGAIELKTNDTGVTVNGVIAEVNGENWAAVVPLQTGQNVIEIKAIDSAGNADRKTMSINTETIQQPVKITSNPSSGIVPLNITFSIDTNISNPIASYKIDFEGDSVTDQETTAPNNVNNTYDTPGIYYPIVSVTDSQGNTYTANIVVNVFSREEMDTLLKGKWGGVKGALAGGDTGTALNYFSDGSKQLYNDVFTVLSGQLPQIAQGMQDIQLIYVKDNAAKYRIRKNELYGGQMLTITYYIYFSKDINGLWKIERF